MERKEIALILANARRLIKKRRQMNNRELVKELMGQGSGAAGQICREVGLDPDGNKTSYNDMCRYIEVMSCSVIPNS